MPRGGEIPYLGYKGMCGPKWFNSFSDALVRNRVLILVMLVINGVWFLHYQALKLFKKKSFFDHYISIRPSS